MDRVFALLAKVPVGPVVAVAAIAGLALMSRAPDAAHRVPDLGGLEVNAAIARATKEGFFARHVFRSGGGVAGTVVRQNPPPGVVRNRRSTITLFVTKGAAQVRVPDLRGVPVDEARRRIDRTHLVPGAVIYKDDDKVPRDSVIETEPRGGRLVDVGTKVDIAAAS